ncbi:glycoside hydrolase family 26 protein [Sinomicrobium soli]|uniref:glycoside hydrolase family 26 protein n=1 Tax=Sinomicrobium sp. N-1-3-6 TaxID=2219864 RepID=UPI000DCB29C8|nr:glycosyl hydrolase [Sinomicrobium sp. N-1-3-6]RAV27469.1 hypothetical protein DN748_18530 [Sinomicrobium sp. N-1-3-6]
MKSICKLVLIPFLFGLTIFCSSCGSDDDSASPPENEDPPVAEQPGDGTLSDSAISLLTNMKANADNGNTLIGHQATSIAGVGWRLWQMPDHSDFKEITNKFPALYGWEFSPRPENQNETYDYVSFDTTIEEARKAYYRGGINTFNMHPYRLDNNGNSWENTPGLVVKLLPEGELHNQYLQFLDKLISELKKLKDNNDNPVPFIFRPYHEANHNWFWWGNTACSDEEYKSLFRFTVEYMRQNGLNNMLTCYAPGYFQNEATYLARYPGDDVVDILGFDGYYGNNDGHGTDWNTLKNHLIILKNIAANKNKPYCWAETGELNLATDTYFTQLKNTLNQAGVKLSYLMFWANYETDQFYIPYDELNNQAIKTDFINFTQINEYQTEGENPDLYN